MRHIPLFDLPLIIGDFIFVVFHYLLLFGERLRLLFRLFHDGEFGQLCDSASQGVQFPHFLL